MENEQQLLFPGMSNFAFVFERYQTIKMVGKVFPDNWDGQSWSTQTALTHALFVW